MSSSAQFLNPSEAAKRLGVSAKALRLYEQRGLVAPVRSAAGWRAYGPDEMARAGEIVALRALGLSLAQVARVLEGDSQGLEPALAAHQAMLETRLRELAATVEKIRGLRARPRPGPARRRWGTGAPAGAGRRLSVAFDLPWPWGGERFELRDIRPLNYIIGPLGSGKTRLAQRLAETLPDAAFLGLDRLAEGGAAARARLEADPALKSRVDQTLAWLVEDGASGVGRPDRPARRVGIRRPGHPGRRHGGTGAGPGHPGGPDRPSAPPWARRAAAVPAHPLQRDPGPGSRGRRRGDHPLPRQSQPAEPVAPYPGAPGYEAVATCLASPEVRARTEGVIAWRPSSAAFALLVEAPRYRD